MNRPTVYPHVLDVMCDLARKNKHGHMTSVEVFEFGEEHFKELNISQIQVNNCMSNMARKKGIFRKMPKSHQRYRNGRLIRELLGGNWYTADTKPKSKRVPKSVPNVLTDCPVCDAKDAEITKLRKQLGRLIDLQTKKEQITREIDEIVRGR